MFEDYFGAPTLPWGGAGKLKTGRGGYPKRHCTGSNVQLIIVQKVMDSNRDKLNQKGSKYIQT